jgi:hypothetical protein
MSTVTDKTWDVFMTASLSDDDLGYPDKVAFVPGDQDWADEVVWHNLTENRPTVVVDQECELLLVPLRRSLIDRARRRVTVNFGQRVNGHAPTYMTTSRLGRHPLRDMREMSPV